MTNDVDAFSFLASVEKAISEGVISREEKDVLLRDMSDILDASRTNSYENDFFEIGRAKHLLSIASRTYRRNYFGCVLLSEVWLKNSITKFNQDEPNYVEYYENGVPSKKIWYKGIKTGLIRNKNLMTILYNTDGEEAGRE